MNEVKVDTLCCGGRFEAERVLDLATACVMPIRAVFDALNIAPAAPAQRPH